MVAVSQEIDDCLFDLDSFRLYPILSVFVRIFQYSEYLTAIKFG